MDLAETDIDGCVIVKPQRHQDERGFFARVWCSNEFKEAGLPEQIVQSSLSFNRKAGTLRGMHLQIPPSKEGKLVRCVRGAIIDAIVDLRGSLVSDLRTVTIRLDDRNRLAIYVPPGCAHGFQTLEDDTDVLYMMTDFYQPHLSRGFRWNDPAFNINWPIDNPIIHERDAGYPDFDKSAYSANG